MKKTAFIIFMISILISGICFAKVYKITFEWDKNTEPDLAGYNLYQKSDASSDYSGIPIIRGIDPSSDTCDLTTDISETNYFVLTAYDTSNNESGPSNEVSFTPDVIAPSPPGTFSIKSISVVIEFE